MTRCPWSRRFGSRLVATLPLALHVAVLAACAPSVDGGADPAVVVIGSGVLRGKEVGSDIVAHLGIPYAKPPIKELRWRPPEAPEPWTGERDAASFGPACPQADGTAVYYRRAARRLGRDTTAVPAIVDTSEDCLYLNVWARRDAGADLRPVFVWVHGGAGTSGAGSDPLFRGSELAARGVVVITVNYRLGPLGFLAHPTLSADDPEGVSGNYALYDLVRALEWVRENAAAFGGDAGRVTIAGQSAGANLIELLMLVPEARGLFHRVVLQSATQNTLRPLRADRQETSGEAAGVRYLAALGIPADTAPAVIRAIPADSLIAAAARAGPDTPTQAVVDGRLIPDSPERLFEQGEAAAVPVLRGSTDDEFALFIPADPVDPSAYRAWFEERYDTLAAAVLAAYPPGPDAEITRRRYVRVLSADAFRVSDLFFLHQVPGPVYLYRFAWRPDGGAVGAFHSIELPFVFGTHLAAGWWDRTVEVERLTVRIQELWVRFAAAGSPNGGGSPPWPVATSDSPVAMVLDSSLQAEPLPAIDMLQALTDRLQGRMRK